MHAHELMTWRFCVVPRDSDSLKLLGITTFIGDENNWNASMAVHGALAAFNPQEKDWS